MEEELDLYLEASEESMQNAIGHLQRELQKVRTGKASPAILEGIMVNYYGSPTPMKQVANISTSDARTLQIKPWEKGIIQEIEKAIFQANLGLTPQNDGTVVRINIPPLTEERRREMVKKAKGFAEDAKIGIRSARKDAMDEIKKAVKDGYSEDAGKGYEEQVQGLTKKYSAEADSLVVKKEKEIMTI